jgi:NADH dehydrogenase [ubiquinone] 1 alpha subcomplex assembly factor 1
MRSSIFVCAAAALTAAAVLLLATQPGITSAAQARATATPQPARAAPIMERTLFSFTPAATDSAEIDANWGDTTDAVMGGVSRSRAVLTRDGTLKFSGTVSLENNGGFAATFAALSKIEDLSAHGAITLRVRGDGKTYQLWMNRARRLAHVARFATRAGEWQTITLPYSDFRAENTFGQPVTAGAFTGNPVTRVGLLISDKQSGPFALEVDWIKAQ